MDVLIGFSTSRHWLSRLIQRAQGAPYSHVFLVYRDPLFQVPVVLEAGLAGFHPSAAAPWWRQHQVLYVVRVQTDLSAGLAAAGPYLGAQYDVQGLAGAGLVTLGRWLRRKWRNPAHGPAQLFCSEVVARILAWAAVPGADQLPPDETTPADLFRFLQGAGAAILARPASAEDSLAWRPEGANA
jgi:hypothetical protein